ncbi:MAG TPA: thiamine-phosphate kinase [Steroidobacteraceae bacterium]|jgi:thiamine-monophosphate kinase|nr:thiamine-phosphate kinase [Steroidobacteraceae bacterium]
MDETHLIDRYFRDLGARRGDVALGVGDDAALLRVPTGAELVLTTDALIEGAHFLPGAAAHSLGHRAMAINLSDIAAMGATPAWALLSLNLPAADEAWLREFADGFGALAARHNVALVGGNLGRGPLSVTVQLAGLVPMGQALRRDRACPGDCLYVSGCIGDAAQGLLQLGSTGGDADAQYLRSRLEYPTPRVALGEALRGVASACIDISDGLYVDAQRLLRASGCGAALQIEALPLSDALRRAAGSDAWQRGLRGGEDYELCFSAAPQFSDRVAELAQTTGQVVSCIGRLCRETGITLRSGNSVIQFSTSGWDHFRD